MTNVLYASFLDAKMAEKAVGALLDHGANKDDISVLFEERYNKDGEPKDKNLVEKADSGITTTTGKDAAAGAGIGAGVGAGIGILAGLASLVIPGFGLVTGGGALATALIGAAGTAVGGAIAGGAAGFLRDMGVDEKAAEEYSKVVEHGGAMIAISFPSNKLQQDEIRTILAKYNADNIRTYEAALRR